jgi:hypothetical protein
VRVRSVSFTGLLLRYDALWFAKTRRDSREPRCSSGLRSDGTRADLFEGVRSLAIARVATRRAAVGDGGGSLTAEFGWDISPGWRSGGAPLVPMVQAADLGRLDHLTGVGGRDGAGVGRIFHEGQMGPRAVVVNEVGREDSVQMSLAEDDYMVETLAADRSDQALDEGVLPRGTGCAHDLGDAHAFEAAAKGRAVNAVAIPHQVLGGGVVGKCFDDLLCGPSGRGVLGDVEVQYASAVMGEDKEDKEDAEGGGRDGEEVDRGEGPQMIVEERSARFGRGAFGARGASSGRRLVHQCRCRA